MRALLACTLAFAVGFVIACLIPDGSEHGPSDRMIAAAVDPTTKDAAADGRVDAAGDLSPDPAVPRPLATLENPPQPVAADQPPNGAASTVVDPAVTPASVEQPVDREWPQWGGSPARNNAPRAANIPIDWDPGRIDYRSGQWNGDSARGSARPSKR